MNSSRPDRWWDVPAAALLFVALMTAATRLVVTNWTEELRIIQTLTLLGLAAGLALGYSRFSPRIAGLFALAYGLFTTGWLVGLTLGPGIAWPERMASIAGRLGVIIYQLFFREAIYDSLLFVVIMSALFWLLSVHAGYTLVRYGNGWKALLPAGLTLFVIHSFDPAIARRAWYLAIFLFFALVLIARTAYLHQHNRWQQSRTALPPHLSLDFIRFTLLVAGVIVLLSWTVPAVASGIPAAERAWQPVRQLWNETKDQFDHAFASLKSTVGIVSDYYGDSLALGRGNRLTDSHVFTAVPPASTPRGTRFYWRARVYDTYTGTGWESNNNRRESFRPDRDLLRLRNQAARWNGSIKFVAAAPLTTLFSPAEPLWVSRPASMEMQLNPDGTIEIISIVAGSQLLQGEVYEVQAAMTQASVAQLRHAGTDYPDWVKERYLQLPPTVTERTRRLAEEITAGLDNPYDKVVAITNYLRENYAYSETVPALPEGRDLVDWFLFDLKQGFCNYYASAEIVMLRSLGIPARWAVGYAQGERDDDGSYIVRQRDSHAWPEVYFPNLGWVEFEPTASQPTIVRPETEAEAEAAAREASPMREDFEAERLRRLEELTQGEPAPNNVRFTPTQAAAAQVVRSGSYLGIALIAALLVWWAARLVFNLPPLPVLFVKALERAGMRVPKFLQRWAELSTNRRPPQINVLRIPIAIERTMRRAGLRPPDFIRRWALQASMPPLTRAYQEINHALTRLGRQPEPKDTPYERARALVSIIPSAREAVQTLVAEYQRQVFGRTPADVEAAQQAGIEIRGLSYRIYFRMRLERLLRRLQRQDVPASRPSFGD